ncbi:hypothetical protein EV127DRAFT_439179 [Xylaria flabelliformis]|nr:hypothetical protein EV127DRAFT_439179 [Xylaria flabelliformis]
MSSRSIVSISASVRLALCQSLSWSSVTPTYPAKVLIAAMIRSPVSMVTYTPSISGKSSSRSDSSASENNECLHPKRYSPNPVHREPAYHFFSGMTRGKHRTKASLSIGCLISKNRDEPA